jgi:hypothetical protein
MFHRTAALTAAILALSAVGSASVAFAGGIETVTVTTPAPPPVTVTSPAPPPVTVTTPAPPPVTVTTPAPAPTPKHSSKKSSGGGSNSSSGTSPSAEVAQTPVSTEVATTSETTTIPQGGVQAGGGGTAIADNAGSMVGVLGAVAGLGLILAGTVLARRRRVLGN